MVMLPTHSPDQPLPSLGDVLDSGYSSPLLLPALQLSHPQPFPDMQDSYGVVFPVSLADGSPWAVVQLLCDDQGVFALKATK